MRKCKKIEWRSEGRSEKTLPILQKSFFSLRIAIKTVSVMQFRFKTLYLYHSLGRGGFFFGFFGFFGLAFF